MFRSLTVPPTVTIPCRPEPISVDPATTALIVVDMQNAYCSKGGYMDLVGFDVSGAAPVIAECGAVIQACRDAGILVVYLQNGFAVDKSDVGGETAPVYHKSNALKFMRANPDYDAKLITRGTWDHEIVDELTPGPGDIVVPKTRYSGFAGTNLDQILRSRGIRSVLIEGTATNVCVESTLRDLYHREYFPIMVTDATLAAGPPGTQQAVEFNVERFFGWCTTGAELRRGLGGNE